MRKILIAIPCMDSVPAQFAHSLALLTSYGIEGVEISVQFNLGSLIYSSRNQLAGVAVSDDADLILWLDSDMVFNPDTLIRLLKDIDDGADFVTGVYYRRTAPFTPTLFKSLEIDENNNAEFENYDDIPEAPFEVAGCGFGCVLMKTDLIRQVYKKFGRLFSPIGEVGEDLSFCWRARQCGYTLMCDPSIDLGHVAHTMVTKGFYLNYQKAKGNGQG